MYVHNEEQETPNEKFIPHIKLQSEDCKGRRKGERQEEERGAGMKPIHRQRQRQRQRLRPRNPKQAEEYNLGARTWTTHGN